MIYISIAVRNNPSRPSAFSQNIEFSSNSNLGPTDNVYNMAKNPASGPINIVKIQRASANSNY